MFYTNLANISYWNSNGYSNQAGSENFNSCFLDGAPADLFSFQNISISYWSNPEDDPIDNASWGVNFQRIDNGDNTVNATSLSTFAMLFFGIAGALATRRQARYPLKHINKNLYFFWCVLPTTATNTAHNKQTNYTQNHREQGLTYN